MSKKDSYFIFGDFDSRNKLLIESVSDFLPQQKLDTTEGSRGVRVTNVKIEQASVKIKASFQENNALFKDFKTILDFRKYLSRNLPNTEAQKLILSDDPSVYYWAYYDGSGSSFNYEPNWDYCTVEISFLIPDATRYSVEEKVFVPGNDCIEIINDGDNSCPIKLEAEFPSDCDYLGFALNNQVMQCGTVVDEKPIKKNTVIFKDEMEDTKHWSLNQAKVIIQKEAQMIGKFGSDGTKNGQAVTDFGKVEVKEDTSSDSTNGQVWHGASLSRYLNVESRNFEIYTRLFFRNFPQSFSNVVQKDQTYKIKYGDTLSGIAKQFNTTVKNLQDWNKIKDPNKIEAGATIIVKKAGSVDKSKPKETNWHLAKKGETVESVSKAFNVSQDNFRNWNNLSKNTKELQEGKYYVVKAGNSKTSDKTGCTVVQAVDSDGNFICGVELKDNTLGVNKIDIRFYVGNNTMKVISVPEKFLNFFGAITIKKIGNKFSFKVQYLDEKTVKPPKNEKDRWIQTAEFINEDAALLSAKRLDYVGMCYAQKPPVYQDCTCYGFTDIPVADQKQEVFTFNKGDKILIENNKLYLNGVLSLNYLAIGSSVLHAPRDISELYFTYPEGTTQPTIKATIREEYN